MDLCVWWHLSWLYVTVYRPLVLTSDRMLHLNPPLSPLPAAPKMLLSHRDQISVMMEKALLKASLMSAQQEAAVACTLSILHDTNNLPIVLTLNVGSPKPITEMDDSVSTGIFTLLSFTHNFTSSQLANVHVFSFLRQYVKLFPRCSLPTYCSGGSPLLIQFLLPPLPSLLQPFLWK